MRWVEEVLFAEVTAAGLLGATALHMGLWLCVGDWDWGLVGRLQRFVKRSMPGWYHGTLAKNYEGDALVEMYRVQKDPVMMFFLLGQTAVHTGWGGLLMYAGWATGRPWLWRHGMLTEVGGVDLLDFAKMAYAKLYPPGPFPMSNAMRNPIYVPSTTFHHLVGMIVGLPVCVWFSDRAEFQWFGFMMLGAPFFVAMPELVGKCVSPEWAVAHASLELWMLLAWFYQRIVFYFPATAVLLRTVMATQLPTYVKAGFLTGSAFLAIFSTIATVIMAKGWIRKWILKDPLARVKSFTSASDILASQEETVRNRSMAKPLL